MATIDDLTAGVQAAMDDRAELSADVWGAMLGERPDPADIVESLDEQSRTVLRITPDTVLMND